MTEKRLSKVGLFSSDPFSARVQSLQEAFQTFGVEAFQIIPWKITRHCTADDHSILHESLNLTELDLLIVLDIGANDVGAFFNRVGILTALAESGVEIVNSISSILLMRNKADTMRKLTQVGLPVPETLITESLGEAARFVNDNFPCVLKPITGFGGEGVQLIDREFDLENIYDYLKFHHQATGKGAFLLQRYIHGPGFDIRAFVLDGKVLASMQRVATEGFVTNIHAGGIPRPNDIDIKEIALKAAEAIGGRMVGVDIIPDQKNNLWLLEVNATPGWTGLQKVTPFDIAMRIANTLSRA